MFVGTRQSGGSSRGSGRVGTRGGSRRCRERGKGPSGRTRGWERATRREGRRHRGAPRAPTRRRRRRRRVSARGWTTHARTRFRGVGHRECVSRVRPTSLRPERGRGWRHPRDAHAASASTRERTRARAEQCARWDPPAGRLVELLSTNEISSRPRAGAQFGERCHISFGVAPPTRGEDAECAARGGARVERYGRDGAYQPRSCVVSCIVSHLALPTASPRRTTRAFAASRLASRLRLIAAGADARPDFSASQIEEAFEKEVKVLVVGNGAVGKTSMMKRFCRDNFTDEYKKTIGVDFLEKTRYVDALREDVRLMVWDTAGQEEFDTITRTYYRGCASPRPPHAAPIPVPSRLISRAHSPPRVFSPHPLSQRGRRGARLLHHRPREFRRDTAMARQGGGAVRSHRDVHLPEQGGSHRRRRGGPRRTRGAGARARTQTVPRLRQG